MNVQQYPEHALWLMRVGLALYLQQQGWSIIPLLPRSKHVNGELIAKVRPGETWLAFQSIQTTAEEIKVWSMYRDTNYAVVTGSLSGITVLDVDSADAYRRLLNLMPKVDAVALIPKLRKVKTSRGRHLYFRYIGGPLTNKDHPVEGIDIRNDGGYAVLPFSVHPNGWVYEWEFPFDGQFPFKMPVMPSQLWRFCWDNYTREEVEDDPSWDAGVTYDDYDDTDWDFEEAFEGDQVWDWREYYVAWKGERLVINVVKEVYSDETLIDFTEVATLELDELPADVADLARQVGADLEPGKRKIITESDLSYTRVDKIINRLLFKKQNPGVDLVEVSE